MRTTLVIAGLLLAAPAFGQDMPLSSILAEGDGWRLLDKGYETIYHLHATSARGVTVLHSKGFGDVPVDGEPKRSDVGPLRRGRGVAFVLSAEKNGYGVSEDQKSILCSPGPIPLPTAAKEVRVPGLSSPSCLAFSPDRGTLFVGDRDGKWIWAFRPETDGTLSAGQPYCPLRLKRGEKASGVSSLTTDAAGRIYAATPVGVQIFDPTGRLCGVLLNPDDTPPVAVAIGGKQLFVATKTAVYTRKLK